MKMFHYYCQLYVDIFAFMYVDLDAVLKEEFFIPTRKIVANYNIMSTPALVSKYCLRFSYICSEEYDLDLNFNETEMKIKS